MTDESEIPVSELADEYLSALEYGADREQLEAAKRQAAEIRERHERFVEKYGESDPATEELSDRLQSVGMRVNELENEQSRPGELEELLLERATTFMLNSEWLQPEVIEVLNKSLVDEEDDSLVIEEVEITDAKSVEDIDDPTRFDIVDVVRQLALDKLGKPSDIRDCWEGLEGTTKERPFRIVSSVDGASPDEVLEHIGDDDLTREAVRGRLKNATQKDVNPYVRRDGVYHLSTVGKYISREYANVDSPPVEEEPAGGEPGDEQATLVQTQVAEGGNSND